MHDLPAEAVILAGGLGTRLRDLFPDRPKGLVPVAGKPFLEWQLGWLTQQGIEHAHLACGHLADQVHAWLDTHAFQLSVSLHVEPEPQGTGGALKFIEDHIGGERFFVLNGDSLLPACELAALARAHETAATISVVPVEKSGRFGSVDVTDGRVTGFREKTEGGAGLVSGGIYLLERTCLAAVPEGGPCSIETEIFPELAEQQALGAVEVPPPLLDMGTPEGLREMEAHLGGL